MKTTMYKIDSHGMFLEPVEFYSDVNVAPEDILVPKLHTLVAPPELKEGQQAYWKKDGWHIVTPDVATLVEVKVQKKAELAEARWQEETAGVILPSGVEVATDDRSQTKMIGIAMKAAQDPGFIVRWKANGQWVTLDASQILDLNVYISNVIQKLFEKEESLSKMVDSCQTIEEVKAITWKQVL